MVRVAAIIARGVSSRDGIESKSILSQAATSFGKRPAAAESTIPTGFDPRAAVLFEAVIEAAFLVANADGVFDEAERRAFETVVVQACQNTVRPTVLHKLVSDLCVRLEREGSEKRVRSVAATVRSPEHKLEVLRIAALMAHVSGGVADSELTVLQQLARDFGLEEDSVQTALDQAAQALQSATRP